MRLPLPGSLVATARVSLAPLAGEKALAVMATLKLPPLQLCSASVILMPGSTAVAVAFCSV